MADICMVESLIRYIGQTVTIFTTSGGLSGEGFTGVLSFVGDDCIKLITAIGAPPACAIGSSCNGFAGYGGFGGGFGGGGFGAFGGGYGCGCSGGYGGFGGMNWLGSVAEIPICKIACFTHNAI